MELIVDKFTQTYLNIITQQGGIGDIPFPRTSLGLDAAPDADHTVISNLLKEWNLEKYANNQQILNIIASDYWVRLAYQKYVKSRGSDDLDLKSSVSGIIYKYKDKFKKIVKEG